MTTTALLLSTSQSPAPNLCQLARNAFKGAWIGEEEKATHLQNLDQVFAL
jgi:adenosine deaminase